MRITHHLAARLFGLAAMLTLGCDDSTAPAEPTTGTIVVTVSTVSENMNVDPDGYILSIDGRQGATVGINASVTIDGLPSGHHLVRLDGLASGCSVKGTNPRSVNVTTINTASPAVVSFSVLCSATGGSSGAGDWDY